VRCRQLAAYYEGRKIKYITVSEYLIWISMAGSLFRGLVGKCNGS
jgi:hypothetical protein